MDGREDLDLYRPAHRPDARTIARWAARTVGILLGLAIAAYGAVLYMLRCFDTCPDDPAQDNAGKLLLAAIVLFGLAVVAASACTGARWARSGLPVVKVLGALIVLCGVAAVAIVPSIEAPGDHSGSTIAGIVAVVVGGASAAGAHMLGRRLS